MKIFFKIANSMFVLIMLLSLTVSPVAAGPKGNDPDPNYKTNGTYIERSHLPYYGANAVVDQYLLGGKYYSEDIVSHQIVGIELQEASYRMIQPFL